ncbi:hypothetical protein GCM10010253_65320 [Streptomyces badius]|uniref:Transposase DDE domain-containing protein n=1 Tax=Streptomyces badius TaxID=1941 RepID=A0ABQ2TRV4_STRBA|nr:hypothetical protein GCM10010253_65320 [Streptomyces badius]
MEAIAFLAGELAGLRDPRVRIRRTGEGGIRLSAPVLTMLQTANVVSAGVSVLWRHTSLLCVIFDTLKCQK